MSMLWMITYDISDDKVRRKVATLLKNRGDRVLYSVFECHIDNKDFVLFRKGVASMLGPEDSVRWYPLCKWCKGRISWQGQGGTTGDPDYFEA